MGSASNEYPFLGSEENQFSLGIGVKSGLRGPSAAGFAELGWVKGAKLAIINPGDRPLNSAAVRAFRGTASETLPG